MNKTFRTTGIVLNKKDWREADSLFTIYTADHGKLDLVAIGCRKIKSKLMGHLSSVGVVDIMVAKSKCQDKLATARLVERFTFDSKVDFYYFNLIFEVLDKAINEGQGDLRLWQLLNNTLKWLTCSSQVEQKNIVVSYFIVQLINELGYRPDIKKCQVCGRSLTNPNAFSLLDNGVLCSSCPGEKITISSDLFSLLDVLLNNELEKLKQSSFKLKVGKELLFFIKRWSMFVLEKEINSFKFI